MFASALAFGLATAALSGAAPAIASTFPVGNIATTAAESHIELAIAPTAGTDVTPSGDVQLTVEVRNSGQTAVGESELRLARAATWLDDPDELEAWLNNSDPGRGRLLATETVRPLAAGTSALVTLTVANGDLDLIEGSPAIGFAADLAVDGEAIATTTTAFANTKRPATRPVDLAVVAPLRLAPESTGLLTRDELATATSPTGTLTRELDALAGRTIAIGVDPRVLVSIRVLGDSAPDSALRWLSELAAAPNEVFPLAYADADVAAQAQLGLESLLQPTSFDDVMNPDNFTEPDAATDDDPDAASVPGWFSAEDAPAASDTPDAFDPGAAPSTTRPETLADPSPAPTPEPSEPPLPAPVPGTVPTTDELLSWPYTRTDIAWPAPGSLATGDLGFLDRAGLTTAILSSNAVENGTTDGNAATTVDGSTAVVAASLTSSALHDASVAASDTEWRGAGARMLAALAVESTSGVATTSLATLERRSDIRPDRVTDTLDLLATSAWSNPTTLSTAIGAPPVARSLASLPEPEDRLENLGRMLDAEAAVDTFSSVVDDPNELTAPTRRSLLALLDAAWIPESATWSQEVVEWLATQSATTSAVSIVPSSSVLVVASDSGILITIENDLDQAANVVVDVQPSNGRLIIDSTTELTVEANSRGTVRIPIAAGVGNGEVDLVVSLESSTGVPVGSSASIPATVRADWEGVGAGIVLGALILFFGIGIFRDIRRRRARRAGENERQSPSEDARHGTSDGASEPASDPEDDNASARSAPHVDDSHTELDPERRDD